MVTHKPVSEQAHYIQGLTLYLIHICMRVGVLNPFKYEAGSNECEVSILHILQQYNKVVISSCSQFYCY